MNGFYSPFSDKPQWGAGIQELLGQLAQMIMIKKMGQQQGSGQLPPPTQPIQRSQGPINQAVQQAPATMPQGPPQGAGQQFMQPMGGQGQRPPTPQGTGGVLGGKDIATLASQLPPEIMQIILKLLEQGKFPQPGAGASSASIGR